MNFLRRMRYGTVAQDQDEAATWEYREARKKDYADENGDHDYGKSSIPDKYNLSLLEKGKGQYWTTKQYVKEKLGVGEDVFSVAEDETIDMCVHRARHTQKQAMKLSMALLKYQKVLQRLTSKETGLGLLLKAYGESETSAGMPGSDDTLALGVEESVKPCRTLMCKLGSAMQSDALMLAELDMPITKMFHEVETFRGKALLDCLKAVSELNEKKKHFRGALLWMTDAANSMCDPDAKKELNNFREAQYMVKVCKKEFEQASTKVQSKTELLLSSLNNLFSLHLPGYVSTLGNQLKSSEQAYGEIFRWSRESMNHQYRRADEIQRERAVDQALDLDHDASFESLGAAADDVQFESWANEDSAPSRGAQLIASDNDDGRDLDWLLDEDDSEDKCDKIQDLLMELSNEKQGSSEDALSSALPDSERREMALDCNMAENSDMLFEGEIKKITNDEGCLEDIIPMSIDTMERQKREVAREEQISQELDDLLAGLEFNVVCEPETVQGQSTVEKGSDPRGGDECSNEQNLQQQAERFDSVNNIWAALESNFSAASMAKEILDAPEQDVATGTESGAPQRQAPGPSSQHKGLMKWFSRKPTEAEQDSVVNVAAAGADAGAATAPASKFASLFEKLEPDADERTLKDLLALDSNDQEGSAFALM